MRCFCREVNAGFVAYAVEFRRQVAQFGIFE